MTPTWDSLEERGLLPPLIQPCGRMEIIKYAAASGDFYPAHVDPEAVESRELGRLIVPGRFKHACLGRLVAEWAGALNKVRRLSSRYVAADPVGRPLTCRGRIRGRNIEGDRRLVRLRLWIEDDQGRITTQGDATLEWKGP